MRLVTYLKQDREQIGLVEGDRVFPVSTLLPEAPTSILELLHGAAGVSDLLRRLAEAPTSGLSHALADLRLLAPVPRPGKIVAVGRNYPDHAVEEGVKPPAVPLIFAKWPTSVIGPDAAIVWDSGSTQKVDYEAELGVVIGERARNVTEASAPHHVFGFTCLNDVSARDVQFSDGQWTRGKSFDTFCPIGPAIVTREEIADPQALSIRCLVNGSVMQESSTSEMYFSIAHLIAFCSRFFTLEPGDIIATGTPAGVGTFREPPVYLADGDSVEVEIEHIGRLSNHCAVVTGVA